ncbi:hypothetical protein Acid345_1503 [Candidatus Koribacter versatilis Ellin345]|uniref:Glycoside hydrolase family 44 catalytic domain-containing protein n=1 Tax=Koribacter versatilis (strain Ellin345) TaxID=204669 RepID=Q1IRJ5_KORVE|nr:glycoside hydrolase family 44 protein [Candidatus Koribacter versatilis]ABF40505.1 hypothetical protein Acid345_1503 [Candidatus Koribacter versatilis Ellin345]
MKAATLRRWSVLVLASASLVSGVLAQEPSSEATTSSTAVTVSVNVLANRHSISQSIYGVNFPPDATYIANSGASFVRWGGNASSRYNWKNFNTSSAADWYFQNRGMGDTALYQDSKTFVQTIANAGAAPVMTIPMLGWVSKDATSYSFSVKTFGAQCGINPYNSDDGNGVKSDCATNLTGVNPTWTSVKFLDSPKTGDPAGSIYLSEWATALSPLFGNFGHFYEMDNEMDIWGGTHRDIHPNPAGYNEMRDVFLQHARALKTFDTKAIRMGPVSCCWWFYFNGANNNDKGNHAGIDFMPWWLNEIYWADLNGTTGRSLDVFDFHAYPDTPDFSGYTAAQMRALELRITRDFWDPTYVSESSTINQPWVTSLQPNRTIPFRMPRIRAIVNSIYPGTQVSVTEWSVAFQNQNINYNGENEFATALADADVFGTFGRERIYAASRWTAADPATPAFQALKIYRNYDGAHHAFGTTSVSATNNGNSSLFSSYGAIGLNNTQVTLMLINKDPSNAATTTLNIAGFTPTSRKVYQLTTAHPTSITLVSSGAWSSSITVPAYSLTLILANGTMTAPSAEWDLNPDATMVPANGTAILSPNITSGTGSVTMTAVTSDAGITVTNTTPTITPTTKGRLTVKAGATSGIYKFTVTGKDNTNITQTKSGWILVGNPSATLAKTGDLQTAPHGTQITLTATLGPGSSGGTAGGATVRFTASAGTLTARNVTTDSTGKATVKLTLPATAGTVTVTAEGPFGLGHPVATFTETAN